MVALFAPAVAAAGTVAEPTPTPPPVTFNEFLPEERAIGDCISAIPKPGCGSEARGGWRQTLVLLAILVGLALIVWRVVAGARRAQLDHASDGATARDGRDGGLAS